jgi:hypothetical protein
VPDDDGQQPPHADPYAPPADPRPPHQQPYPQQPYGQQPPHGQPYQQQPGYGAQAGGYAPAGPTTSSKATAVLVLGISSLILLSACGIGLITGVIALAMAPGAKREIRDSQGRLTGLGLVQGGVITSWISVGLAALGLGVLVIVLLAQDTLVF